MNSPHSGHKRQSIRTREPQLPQNLCTVVVPNLDSAPTMSQMRIPDMSAIAKGTSSVV